jgi:hypothetical protein
LPYPTMGSRAPAASSPLVSAPVLAIPHTQVVSQGPKVVGDAASNEIIAALDVSVHACVLPITKTIPNDTLVTRYTPCSNKRHSCSAMTLLFVDACLPVWVPVFGLVYAGGAELV